MPPAPPSDPLTWGQRLDPRRSLATFATLVVGGTVFGLVLLITWLAGVVLHHQIEGQTGALFENLAAQFGDKLERSIYERYRQLQFTAGLPAFREATALASDRSTVIQALQAESPDFAWIGFADAKGALTLATQHLFEGDLVGDTAWYRGARRRPFAGAVRHLPVLANLIPGNGPDATRFLDLAVPVNSSNGQFGGVLGAQLHWSLAREIQLSVIPETARREHLGVTLYTSSGEILLDSGGSGWTEPPEAPPGLSERPSAHGSFTENTGGGTTYLTGYTHTHGFREYRGLDWLIVVRQPVADAFAAVHTLRLRIFLLGSFIVALLGIAIWFYVARLERRFRAIATAAHRIGTGDILSLIPSPAADTDFARMCTALGVMVGNFRHREETLDTENTRLRAANQKIAKDG